ncbi:MAG: hypothetical protein E6833_34525, partial [Bradyrhizobium sp.]|nr:hypothetical protein [Bradyrhizobium sp.]
SKSSSRSPCRRLLRSSSLVSRRRLAAVVELYPARLFRAIRRMTGGYGRRILPHAGLSRHPGWG